MEWNPKTPSLWDWDSLALFGGGERGGGDNGSVYSSDLGNGSSSKSSISASVGSSAKAGREAAAEAPGPENPVKNKDSAGRSPPAAGAAGYQEALIGLKLGKRTYFEDACTGTSAKNPPSSSSSASPAEAPVKKPKASPQSARSAHCQVEGCSDDLRTAKEYHRKHRVCENHSKSPRVVVNGQERRFCQQCSRFHDLSEFDQKKRSCRRRLSDHNARRRKPQPDTISFNTARLSSSFHDDRQNLLWNKALFGHMRPMASSWEGSCDFKLAQLKGSWMKSTKAGAIDGQLHLANSQQSNAFSTVCHEVNKLLPHKDTTAEVLDQGLEASVTASNLGGAPDLRRALSLLSTNSWSSANPGPASSLVHLVHVNPTSVAQPAASATISTSDYWQDEHPLGGQQVRGLPFAMHSNGSQFQEYQLLRSPYETAFLDASQIH